MQVFWYNGRTKIVSFSGTCWAQQTTVECFCGDIVIVLGYWGLKFYLSQENMRETARESSDPYEWSHLVKFKRYLKKSSAIASIFFPQFSLPGFQDLILKLRKGYLVGFHIGLFLWTICFIDFFSNRIDRGRTGRWISRSLCFLFMDFPCWAMRKINVPHLLLIFRTCVTKAKILFWRPHQTCFNVYRMK